MSADLFRSFTPLVIGVTPLLAVCTTSVNGLLMGVACFLVLIFTGITVSGIKLCIPPRYKLIYLLLVTSTWTSVVDVLFQAYAYPLRDQLGIYIYILAMNTAILYFLDEIVLRRRVNASALSAVTVGVLAIFLCVGVGLLRELLTHGGILTDVHGLLAIYELGPARPVYFFDAGLSLFKTPAGAFIIFGLLLAIPGYFQMKHNNPSANQAS